MAIYLWLIQTDIVKHALTEVFISLMIMSHNILEKFSQVFLSMTQKKMFLFFLILKQFSKTLD